MYHVDMKAKTVALANGYDEMREYLSDCYEMRVSEEEIMQRLFYLIQGSNCHDYKALAAKNPHLVESEEAIVDAIEVIIQKLNLNVNEPCFTGRQDVMYHAIKYGSAQAVQMLFENGYDGTNLISGVSAYFYINRFGSTIPEYDKKKLLFEVYHFDSVQKQPEEMRPGYSEVAKRQRSNIKVLSQTEMQKIREASPIAAAVLEPYVALNEEKATLKLVENLMSHDATMEEFRAIFGRGLLYDSRVLEQEGRTEYLPAYLRLLDSAGIKHPPEIRIDLEK